MPMTTEIAAYFADGCGRCARFATADCAARRWHEGLAALRALCLDAGLEEHVKWGNPCYMHAGRNVAIIGAFRGDFRLSFFEPALLADPQGLLDRSGPNTPAPDMIRFRSAQDVTSQAAAIAAYLTEAMDHAAAGRKAPKATQQVPLPAELTEALAADPELAGAFAALTPGRQKGYAINLNQAKQAATRVARIKKFRAKILEGKGPNER